MNIIQELKSRIKSPSTKVVFPEGEDERVLQAVSRILHDAIGQPILLGNADSINKLAEQLQVDIKGIEIIDPISSQMLESYLDIYCQERDFPRGAAQLIITKPVYFGAMMVKAGDADTMVAGVATETEEVVMAGELIIGLEEGISIPSSFTLMEIPGYTGEEGNYLIFADTAINPDPTAEQLADITIASAKSVKELFGWEPRVALLSFSTKESAYHESVDKVIDALSIIKEKAPDLCVDGEMQADAAIVPEVAKKKIKEGSPVAGRANILIFPDLNAGNISYKLVQRLARGAAFGPFVQGFARHISDLSRGASVEDIIGATILVVVRVQTHENTCS